jgi:hypothetical protein
VLFIPYVGSASDLWEVAPAYPPRPMASTVLPRSDCPRPVALVVPFAPWLSWRCGLAAAPLAAHPWR